MMHPTLKKLAFIAVSSIGLYFSGLNLITMSGVKSISDALNVMIFFTCFFPFFFMSLNILSGMFKAVLKIIRFEILYFKVAN